MTDSRETMRRRAFRDHAEAAVPAAAATVTGKFLAYECPTCGRRRQTSANQPPERCPTCILTARAAGHPRTEKPSQ